MNIFEALFLGIIQGVTEWLPISSSGHLVVVQSFFGTEQPVIFDAVVHMGTLLAVLLARRAYLKGVLYKSVKALLKEKYYREIKRDEQVAMGYGAIIATIPIVIVGLLLRNFIEASFSSITVVAVGLPITGFILLSLKGKTGKQIFPKNKNSIIVGLAQTLALLPGISRSGMTIVAGVHSGLERRKAVEFSFLMSIFSIGGAGALQFYSALQESISVDVAAVAVGFLASFFVGYWSIKALMKLIKKRSFHRFGYYCLAAGACLWFYIIFV